MTSQKKYLQAAVVGKMHNKKLSKRYKTIYRMIGCGGLVLLMSSLIMDITIILNGGTKDFTQEQIFFLTLRFLINIISVFAFILIVIKPERCELFALISLIYTFSILISDNGNLIPVFMAILAVTVLVTRGFFTKKKELKIIVLSVLYIAALCSEIRFGKVDFIRSVLNNIAAFFISAISFIFIQKYIANISARFEPRILDLTKYDELDEQDKEIIKLLKEGQKYDWIAGNQKMATSTLKKHVRRIFQILDVSDLVEFHAEFGGREIIYTKEELLEWKKRFLEENHPA